MAEERNPMTPAEHAVPRSETAQPRPAGHAGPTGGADTGRAGARDQDPQAIEADIRHTRAEMSETLDAIGARFQPDYIKDQAKDAIRHTARDAGNTMLDTIKENPIPSLIAGLSLGWLIARGSQSGRDRYVEENYRRYGRYPAYGARGSYRAYGDPYAYGRYQTGYEEDEGSSMKERAGEMKERAGEMAHRAQESASHLADRAEEQLHDLGDQAQRYGRRATNWLEHQMNASPLAVGAVALAAGAMIGFAVPETRREDEWMGHASDRAKEAAQEKVHQAKAVAQETAHDVKEHVPDLVKGAATSVAKDVMHDAKEHAKEHDLDEPPKSMGSRSSDGSERTTAGTTAGSSASGASPTPGRTRNP